MYIYTDDLLQDILWEIENKTKQNKIMIQVLPYDVTEKLCETIKDIPNIRCCVVSINDEAFPPTRIWEECSVWKIFRMIFADIDITDAPYLMKYAATAKDLAGLKEFIDEIKEECNFLIVHCAAGISRSPAVASVIEEYMGYEDSIWSSGKYHPNRHVYQLTLSEFGICKTEEEIDTLYKQLNHKRGG